MSKKYTKQSFDSLLNESVIPAINTELGITINLYIGTPSETIPPAILVDYVSENPTDTTGQREILTQIRIVTSANDWALADDIQALLYSQLGLNTEKRINFNEYEYSDPLNPTLTGNSYGIDEKSGCKDIGKDLYPDLTVYEFEISLYYKS